MAILPARAGSPARRSSAASRSAPGSGDGGGAVGHLGRDDQVSRPEVLGDARRRTHHDHCPERTRLALPGHRLRGPGGAHAGAQHTAARLPQAAAHRARLEAQRCEHQQAGARGTGLGRAVGLGGQGLRDRLSHDLNPFAFPGLPGDTPGAPAWGLAAPIPPLPADKAAKGANRKGQPVEVVVQVEVAREAGSGELRLVPGAVRALGFRQPADPALGGLAVALAGGEQREQRPRGLRRGGRALAGPGRRVVVGAQVLAPAAVGVLVRPQPGDRTADRRLARLDPGGDQGGHDRARAVDVVRAPAAEPGPVGLLVLQQPDHAAAAGGLAGKTLGGERLDDVRGDVGARRVDHRAEVAERQLVHQLAGVVRVERAPPAVLALHALEPAQAPADRRSVFPGLGSPPARQASDLVRRRARITSAVSSVSA